MSECSSYVLKAQHFGKTSALQDPQFRFRFWVLFSMLGITVESNISELKKLAQIFLQQFTSPKLQHILWSIYSFPDFSFMRELSKFHGTLWDCWAWKKCQSSRWGAHESHWKSLSCCSFLHSLPFSQETHWQHEHCNQLLTQMFKSEPWLLFSIFISIRSVIEASLYSLLHFPVITGAEQLPQKQARPLGSMLYLDVGFHSMAEPNSREHLIF